MNEDALPAFLPGWLPVEILSAVSVGDARVDDLYPGERKIVERAVPSRQIEFATGRVLARMLMGRLGHEPAPLLSAADRSPSWPIGVIGSISHTNGMCGVVIARSGPTTLGIGIDVEQDRPLEERSGDYVLTEGERNWLSSHHGQTARSRLAMVAFSAKEAIYKCLHPLGNAGLRFCDVELRISPGVPTIAANPGPELARRIPDGSRLECGYGVANGFIQTAAVLRG